MSRRVQFGLAAIQVASGLAILISIACTPQQVQGARSAVEVTAGACCASRYRAGATPEEIKEVCAVTQAAAPFVDALLGELAKHP